MILSDKVLVFDHIMGFISTKYVFSNKTSPFCKMDLNTRMTLNIEGLRRARHLCGIVYHGKPVKVSSGNNLKSIRAQPVPHDPCFVGRSDQFLVFLKSARRLSSRKHGNLIFRVFNFFYFQICPSSDRQKTQKPRKHARPL